MENKNTVVQQNINQETEIDLAGLFWRLLERAWLLILAAVVGAAIAGVYTWKFITPMYQATSKIYIIGSDTTISLSDLQLGSNLTADYTEIFRNWHVHELVDQRLGLDYSYSKLNGMVSVSNPNGTHVLYITVTSPDPEEAKLLADTYAQVSREFIAAKMDMREPNVFEEARVPAAPVSPNRTRNVIIGFLIGALIVAALVTVKYLTDDRIRTDDDVKKVGQLTVLGMVPIQDMKKNADKGTPSGNYYHGGRKREG